MDPAIGMIETISIAAGIKAADAMVKRSPVELLECRPVCPGKYIVLITGLTDPVNEAMESGVEAGADAVVDTLLLPNVHPSIFPAMVGAVDSGSVEALGIVETISVASTIVAGDAAAKAAEVLLTEMRIANGLGGKSFFLLVGDVPNVQAAVQAALEKTREQGLLLRHEIIEQLHQDVKRKIMV